MPIGMLGYPDALTGHGYGSLSANASGRSSQRTAPYTDVDVDPTTRWEDDDEGEPYVDPDFLDTIATPTATYVPVDVNSLKHDFWTFGTFSSRNYVPEASTQTEIDVVLNEFLGVGGRLFTIAPGSSNPDVNTIYGWSAAPQWPEPRRRASEELYSYVDIVLDDADRDWLVVDPDGSPDDEQSVEAFEDELRRS